LNVEGANTPWPAEAAVAKETGIARGRGGEKEIEKGD